jgi:hypothetical protein
MIVADIASVVGLQPAHQPFGITRQFLPGFPEGLGSTPFPLRTQSLFRLVDMLLLGHGLHVVY